MSKPIVLVTGASGFLASHIITLLLAEGYAVRGTVRPGRMESLLAAPIAENKDFSLVQVDDIATSDLSGALKDVKFIVHTASPLAGKASPQETLQVGIYSLFDGTLLNHLKTAKNGTLNVLAAALKAGVSKVVLTSSWGTTLDPSLEKTYQGVVFTEKGQFHILLGEAAKIIPVLDWGSVTEEEFLNGVHNPLWTYLAAKIIAETTAWKFAKENPALDLATINPPFIYGPPNAQFPPVTPDRLGANIMIYSLIHGQPGRPPPAQLPPFFCDVRDVARAHVKAITVNRSETPEEKRFLVSGGHFTWKEAVEYLEKQPDLKSRLPSVTGGAPDPARKLSSIDVTRAREILHVEEYVRWESTIDDTISVILLAEKKLAKV
ncbi:NAD-P-binding protein [Armillaria novae-zelandiae]|uniref:NAD-P-binding protein n=1 Tax=Armillaria novae-zelandiae TaxID=153914 RepID=A0AA39UBM9_9AGAR|nr:NAD-P-binding protein [Armillaria novae-zelandiae]